MPEEFDDVTLMFSDLVGFSDFVNYNQPLAVTVLLSEVEHLLDTTLVGYEVYKVEAVNDSNLVR